MIEFDLRQELLDAFEAEYREHLGAMRTVLDAGNVAGPGLRDLFRRAHSLKGASRAVDLPQIEAIAHAMETLLFGSVERGEALPADAVAEVQRGLDSIEAGMRGAPPAATPTSALPETASQAEDAPASPEPSPDAALRVSTREIDRLADAVHAASDAMLAQEHGRRWLVEHERALRDLLVLCDQRGAGLAADIERGLRDLASAATTRLRDGRLEDWQLDRTIQAMRAQMERVALVSADSVFGPLAPMARELARAQGDEVHVTLSGMALLAERPVLQGLRDPAIQLLRNAIGHGLRGRPPGAGPLPITLAVAIRAGRLDLSVEDDGPGPDLAAIERTARARGLLPPGAPTPHEAGLLALAFEPGFSTAAAVDHLSGRGMGLSIVAEAAARLRGTASMAARRGPDGAIVGTALVLSVPLAARRQTLLLVEAAGHLVAVPAAAVRRLIRVPANRIERPDGAPIARIAGPDGETRLGLLSLSGLLGGEPGLERALLPVVVLDGLGLVVDRLVEVRTLVVRTPDLVGLDRSLVGGIAVIGRDGPVLVLEPGALSLGARTAAGIDAAPKTAPEPAAMSRRQATILVVDDSITTRTLEKSILQAQGYRVLIAVDGQEALGVLRTTQGEIDVVVADVEMPRLDGFGLVAAMQSDPRLKPIPAVLMTSRNQESDIRRGLDLGARAYLTKQDFEQGQLLSVIASLLPGPPS